MKKKSKYYINKQKVNDQNLPTFSNEELSKAIGGIPIYDDEGNKWIAITSHYKKTELYCVELHLSIPLFKGRGVPIDMVSSHIDKMIRRDLEKSYI